MVRSFNPDCTACPRLARHLARVRSEFPSYHARPVAPFGPRTAELLIVGLAPGLHGANATGRPFTGDHAGVLLYRTLFELGFANRAEALARGDGLRLLNCRITNSVKCLPPENKPLSEEIGRCNGYLRAELAALSRLRIVLALGRVAHAAVLKALALKPGGFAFAHGACHRLPNGLRLLDSYHCSRYNTQTGRLTDVMFKRVVARARQLIDER